MGFNSWLLFSSIALMATLTPGPAILLASTHSASFGAKQTVPILLGNISGLFIMSLLSVLGLNAIILHSAPIFAAVKFSGAAYLIYLGIKMWRNGRTSSAVSTAGGNNTHQRPRPAKLYTQGLFVALSNPKAIAFCSALFPQFIQTDKPMLPQFCILIFTFMFLSFICLYGYATVAEGTRNRSKNIGLSQWFNKLFGTAFIGSGILLATASRK